MSPLLLVALVFGGVDTLAKVSLDGLTFKGPTGWSMTEDAGKHWSSPGGEAELAVSVYPVAPPRPAKTCVEQLVEAVGKAGFENATLGGQPAAKKVMTDYVGQGEGAKTEDHKVTTTTVLGCDGKTKWVLTWSAKNTAATRFGPILKRILDSISYGK